MAKRRTREEYIELLHAKEVESGTKITTNLNKLEKIILSTKIRVSHDNCGKSRMKKVGDYIEDPTCGYCRKIAKNEALIERRKKAYSNYTFPEKGVKTPKREIANPELTGPLKVGQNKTGRSPSTGEIEIANILEKLKVPYTAEKPIYLYSYSKTPLRADFCVELNGHNYIIEFDGGGHFKAIPKYGGFRGYYKTLRLDEAKDIFVRRHKNFSMLRIPYWELKNAEAIIREYLPLT